MPSPRCPRDCGSSSISWRRKSRFPVFFTRIIPGFIWRQSRDEALGAGQGAIIKPGLHLTKQIPSCRTFGKPTAFPTGGRRGWQLAAAAAQETDKNGAISIASESGRCKQRAVGWELGVGFTHPVTRGCLISGKTERHLYKAAPPAGSSLPALAFPARSGNSGGAGGFSSFGEAFPSAGRGAGMLRGFGMQGGKSGPVPWLMLEQPMESSIVGTGNGSG